MSAETNHLQAQVKKEYELLDQLFDELFPLMRSITGPGIERSMEIFGRYMPLEITKVPTGTKVFDWIVPREWHFKHARLTDPEGKVVCDAKNLNLHVVNYSEPVNKRIDLTELQKHLFSIENKASAVPYVTSYYKKRWGFCISHEQRQKLIPGEYHAAIEASFVDGGVPFAQCKLEGESPKEILISSYLCHPSLANNELSGPLVLLSLYNRIKAWPKRRYTYRFLLNPETIGSLCFLYKHARELKENLVSGLVLTCMGGPSESLTYKTSKRAISLLDSVVAYQDKKTLLPVSPTPFHPRNGSDERQYCSPGFNLPVGQLSRTTYGQYVGYHNSFDDKAFMGIDKIVESAQTTEQLLKYAEIGGKPVNLSPFGEPQLGKRNLYPQMNSPKTKTMSEDELVDGRTQLNRMLTLLNMADGKTTLMEIAAANGCTMDDLKPVLEKLENAGLIRYNVKMQKL